MGRSFGFALRSVTLPRARGLKVYEFKGDTRTGLDLRNAHLDAGTHQKVELQVRCLGLPIRVPERAALDDV